MYLSSKFRTWDLLLPRGARSSASISLSLRDTGWARGPWPWSIATELVCWSTKKFARGVDVTASFWRLAVRLRGWSVETCGDGDPGRMSRDSSKKEGRGMG